MSKALIDNELRYEGYTININEVEKCCKLKEKNDQK